MILKKTLVFAIVFLFVFSSSFVYAQEDTEPTETEEQEIEKIYADAQKYAITPVGLKISAIQLENTFNWKIKELEIIINKIYDQNILSEEDIVFLKEKLSDLIVLQEYVSSRIINNENLTKEEAINKTTSVRRRFQIVVQEVQEYLKEIIPSEELEEVKQKILTERQEIRQQTITQNREKIKELVKEHNDYVKERIVKPTISQKITEIDVTSIREKITNRAEVVSRAAQDVREKVTNVIREREAIQRERISEEIKITIGIIDEESRKAREDVLNAIRQQGRELVVTADVRNIGAAVSRINFCQTDEDCVPFPGECHTRRCINNEFYERFLKEDLICTMEIRPGSAYSQEDCVCVNNVCTNKNLNIPEAVNGVIE